MDVVTASYTLQKKQLELPGWELLLGGEHRRQSCSLNANLPLLSGLLFCFRLMPHRS